MIDSKMRNAFRYFQKRDNNLHSAQPSHVQKMLRCNDFYTSQQGFPTHSSNVDV